jgi:alpha-glucoside transport system permease protein
MKDERSFSPGDFVTFMSAVLFAVALFLPWFDLVETKGTDTLNYSLNGFANLDSEAATNVRLLPFYNQETGTNYLLLGLPLALGIGLIAGIKGWADRGLRQVTGGAALIAGLLGLVYFALVFSSGTTSYTIPTDTGSIQATVSYGFWLALIACIGLVVQIVLPHPTAAPLPLNDALINLGLAIVVPLLTLGIIFAGFLFLRSGDVPYVTDRTTEQIIVAIVAIVWGVGGITLLFFVGNWFVEGLGQVWMDRIQPFIFVGPALALLGWYLAIPVIRTFWASLFNRTGQNFVGMQNYVNVFFSEVNTKAWTNNIFWMVIGTSLVVILALLIAILADRSKFESTAKSLIFMPMAISMVGAGVIWKFIYDVRPEIGMLNAIVTSFGMEAQGWLTIVQPWNNVFLVIVMVWLQTGYAMVLISAAIKGIAEELLEAARVDGANEFQIFFQMIIPMIAGTLVTVVTTVVIFTLKIFDIVRVMTGGNFGTDVIGVRFYNATFSEQDKGQGAAIAIVLLLAVIPIMFYNLREFNKRDVF